MNKKFLSAILFGALMVTSTGTFVSCKDYDDDIENLQGQIDKLATKDELSSQISTLQAALNAAAANANAAVEKATAAEKAAAEAEAAAIAAVQEELATVKAELEEMVAGGLGTNADALAAMNEAVKAVEAKAEALIGEISAMVTDVAIGYYSDGSYNIWVDRVVEKDAVFGDKTTIKADENLTFTAKRVNAVESDPIIVRVSPTNAVLQAENISLINSDGENLDKYLEVANVEPYDGDKLYNYSYNTYSRNASVNKTGLWQVTFKLKADADLEAFEKEIVAKTVKAQNSAGEEYVRTYQTAYAFAVKNTMVEEGAAERNVVSGYTLGLRTSDESQAKRLDFYADNTNVREIRNRWYKTEAGGNDDIRKVQELQWLWNDKTPAVAPIVKGDDLNVEFKVVDGELTNWFDNRNDQNLLPAVKGEPIVIRINSYKNEDDEWVVSQKIAGFYVTLDTENALESAPSEINAWNSYEYENVGTEKQAAKMFKGNTGSITIKDMNNVLGDVIGFRVYAVNLDGTLMDPDGRAFYVSVGNPAAEAQTISATITPDNYSEDGNSSVTVDLTAAQSEVITSLLKNQKNNPAVVMADNKPIAVDKDGKDYPVDYTVEFKWNKDETKVVSATFKFIGETTIASLINDQTYKASIVYKNKPENENGHILGEVNFELTKVMPTVFPEKFEFRPKQEQTDGSGKFVAYMVPENDYNTASAYGLKDMNNVFYGLDDNYSFTFATSALDEDGEVVSIEDIQANEGTNPDYYYELRVAKAFIDSEEWHAVTVNYLYRGVSTKKHAEKDYYLVGEDHAVKYTEKALEAQYACWHTASEFEWGTYKSADGKSTLSYKPALQWTAEGVGETANLKEIWSTNSYNNDFFGLDLEALMVTKGWLKLAGAAEEVENPVKLVAGNQVNPYFVPAIEGSKIVFTQVNTQVDAAPTADHTETLVITVVDAFGHVREIPLEVTVKAPEKK